MHLLEVYLNLTVGIFYNKTLAFFLTQMLILTKNNGLEEFWINFPGYSTTQITFAISSIEVYESLLQLISLH